MLAVTLLVVQAASRRTAALIGLALLTLGTPRAGGAQQARRPRSPAERAWDRRDLAQARDAYVAEIPRRGQDDTAWYNAGSAALAAGDAETAQADLGHAAASLDPELRFRALYDLGVLGLREAVTDSANRDAHLADAERAYREALLLQPHSFPAKWNLELAVRRRGGSSSQNNPPPAGGGGAPQGGGGAGGSAARGGGGAEGGLSQSQADQILRSIGQEELNTRRDRTGHIRRAVEPGVKDW